MRTRGREEARRFTRSITRIARAGRRATAHRPRGRSTEGVGGRVGEEGRRGGRSVRGTPRKATVTSRREHGSTDRGGRLSSASRSRAPSPRLVATTSLPTPRVVVSRAGPWPKRDSPALRRERARPPAAAGDPGRQHASGLVRALTRRLLGNPTGCPWDREQTIRRFRLRRTCSEGRQCCGHRLPSKNGDKRARRRKEARAICAPG